MTCLCAHFASLMCLLLGQPGEMPAPAAPSLITSRIAGRVLRHFDFDERRFGNYETMPKGWSPIAGPGYPRFAESRFDPAVGHDAPPSFRFDVAGGKIGARFVEQTIDVHPDSDYEICAWIRTSKLEFAGAFITAVLMDHAQHEIEASRCTSEMATGTDGSWQCVRLTMHGGFAKARWLGLSCRIEQLPASADFPRAIQRQQVHASVWFDDIVVTRLPRSELELKKPWAVFTATEPVLCRVSVKDINASDLECRLYVRNGQGRALVDLPLDGGFLRNDDHWIDLTPPNSGWYEASLEIRSGEKVIVEQHRPFIRLAKDSGRQLEPTSGKQFDTSGIGLICHPLASEQESVSGELIESLRPSAIKVPVWSQGLSDDEIVKGNSSFYAYLQRLQLRKTQLVGVLESVPAGLAHAWKNENQNGDHIGPVDLAMILSSPIESWRAHLAMPMTRYGRFFDRWQIGSDFEDGLSSPQLEKAMENLRSEYPTLNWGQHDSIALTRNAACDVHRIPAEMSAGSLENLPVFAGAKKGCEVWVSIEPQIRRPLGREARLSEFAQKLITSRCLGATMVFAPQPWQWSRGKSGWIALPDEEFVVQHTLNHALRGLRPVERLATSAETIAWLWTDASKEHGAIVLWATAAGASDIEVEMDIGSEARQVDMFGNSSALSSSELGEIIRVRQMPTIIGPITPRRVMLATGLKMTPASVVAGAERTHRLTFKNELTEGLRGELELRGPARWHINPARMPVDLPPGGTLDTSVSIRAPINEPSGDMVVVARFLKPGDPMNGLTLRTPIRIEPQGLDVSVLSRVEDGGLRVFQRVTSLVKNPMRLRSFVVTDGRQVGGGIFELAGGQSTVREYRIDAANIGADVPMRVSVEQIDGPLRDNRIISLE
jgi:hypothetical protein